MHTSEPFSSKFAHMLTLTQGCSDKILEVTGQRLTSWGHVHGLLQLSLGLDVSLGEILTVIPGI